MTLVQDQTKHISQVDDPFAAQYYVAMGFMVFVHVTQSLPAFVYRIELRTNKTVHPTLRAVCQREAEEYKKRYPNHALHVDMDLDDWDVRRVKQTIMEKE
jgi:cytidylate kinase